MHPLRRDVALWIERPSLALQASIYLREHGNPKTPGWDVVRPAPDIEVGLLIVGGFVDDDLLRYLARYRRLHGRLPKLVLLYDGLANRLPTRRLFVRQVKEKRGPARKTGFAAWFVSRLAIERWLQARGSIERFDAYASKFAGPTLRSLADQAGWRSPNTSLIWIGQPLSEDRLVDVAAEVEGLRAGRSALAGGRHTIYVPHPREAPEKLAAVEALGFSVMMPPVPAEAAVLDSSAELATFFSSAGYNLALLGRRVNFVLPTSWRRTFAPEYALLRHPSVSGNAKIVEIEIPIA